MTVCTIDVHARDVVAKLISQKASCRDFMYFLLFTKSGVFVKNISKKAIFFKLVFLISSMKLVVLTLDGFYMG